MFKYVGKKAQRIGDGKAQREREKEKREESDSV